MLTCNTITLPCAPAAIDSAAMNTCSSTTLGVSSAARIFPHAQAMLPSMTSDLNLPSSPTTKKTYRFESAVTADIPATTGTALDPFVKYQAAIAPRLVAKVFPLLQLCQQALIRYVTLLDYMGDVPYMLLEPVQ